MKPLILITNDDGIFSPGLTAVAEAVFGLGDLLIVAPRQQQTGMGRTLPISPGTIEQVTLRIDGKPHPAYGVDASPALVVVHGIIELASRKPDLCISGINYGDNVGAMIAASGTLGAAFEASTNGIPALAVSRQADLALHRSGDYADLDWSAAAYFTGKIAAWILQHGLPPGVDVLNLNIPENATPQTELRITVQSQQPFYYYAKNGDADLSQPFRLKTVNAVDLDSLEPESDIRAMIYDGVVSLTPLTRNMTAPVQLDELTFL